MSVKHYTLIIFVILVPLIKCQLFTPSENEELSAKLLVCDHKFERTEEELRLCNRELKKGERSLESLNERLGILEEKLTKTSDAVKVLQYGHEDLETDLKATSEETKALRAQLQTFSKMSEHTVEDVQIAILTFVILFGLVQSWLAYRILKANLWRSLGQRLEKMVGPVQEEVERLKTSVAVLSRGKRTANEDKIESSSRRAHVRGSSETPDDGFVKRSSHEPKPTEGARYSLRNGRGSSVRPGE